MTDVESIDEEVPKEYVLYHNYPNPFNPSTTIAYALKDAQRVKITIHDLQGRHIATLVDAHQPPGRHEVIFRTNDLSSGVYFYRMEAGTYLKTKELILLK